MINDVVNRLDEIIRNPQNESLDMLGSYIVGATIVRDDIDPLYEKYPLLEEIAELGAELETLGSSDNLATEVFDELQAKIEQLKKKL